MKFFKTFFIFFLALLFVLSVNSCEDKSQLGSFNKVGTAEIFKKLIQGDDVQLLDFRLEADFATGHIPGAINIPATAQNALFEDAPFYEEVLRKFDKTGPLFMYGGNDFILEHLIPGYISKIGFGKSHTYILSGGFDRWKAAFPEEIAFP